MLSGLPAQGNDEGSSLAHGPDLVGCWLLLAAERESAKRGIAAGAAAGCKLATCVW